MKLLNHFAQSLPALSSLCLPAPTAQPDWAYFNDTLGQTLGIERSPHTLSALSGKSLFEGSQPIAMAYSGHQFGHFNPNLGDGRAHLLGEIETPDGLIDLALKGSGQTPYSRAGDGRATLGPMLREVLISEHLHALGIPSTRALAVVTTGQAVARQFGPEPGAILARTAASHIRIGSFEHLAARGQLDELQQLFDYTCARHYPGISHPMELLQAVCTRQAKLIAQWMSVGFIHGVMNTDNMTLSGESIDFGPCAFMDAYDPKQVFSSIDRGGRYAYQNQPSIAQWNLTRLAECLVALEPESQRDTIIEQAKNLLANFMVNYRAEFEGLMAAKLGLSPLSASILEDWLNLLEQQGVDWTQAHAYLPDAERWLALFKEPGPAQQWRTTWLAMSPDLASMARINPWIVARNHQVEGALQAAQEGDLAPFERALSALQTPFQPPRNFNDWGPGSPGFAAGFRTYCGT